MTLLLFCQAANHYLLAVRISYRLLLMQPEFFSEQWNWSCFLDLVKKSVNLDLVHVTKDAKVIADIKWCGIQILCTILGMSDKAVENFGVGAEEAALCLLRLVLVNAVVFMHLGFFSLSKMLVCCFNFQLGGVLSGCSYREVLLIRWIF